MRIRDHDTIAAVATPPGEGAIGIIRISGASAHAVAEKCFRGRVKLSEVAGYTVHHGFIVDRSGKEVDEVLVTVFRSPHSYAGEDSVEVNCHGGLITTDRILKVVLECGARQADPGEFTRRAFLNGKLDLSQAEAVADLIAAKSTRSQEMSLGQLRGNLGLAVRAIKESLVEMCALLEVDLDFSEEGITIITSHQVSSRIEVCKSKISALLCSYTSGKVLREGVRVALVGLPNAGKSSIFNRLLEEDRAIVAPTPGTTRDYLEESISISGVLFSLTDTAGLRKTDDFVEAEGLNRTVSATKMSDIVVAVIDSSITTDRAAGIESMEKVGGASKVLLLFNKLDIACDKEREPSKFELNGSEVHEIFASALTGQGMGKVCQTLLEMAVGDRFSENEGIKVSSQRIADALRRALEFLSQAEESVNSGHTSEFVALDVRGAVASLSEITGEVTNEDVLSRVFSSFCIGK